MNRLTQVLKSGSEQFIYLTQISPNNKHNKLNVYTNAYCRCAGYICDNVDRLIEKRMAFTGANSSFSPTPNSIIAEVPNSAWDLFNAA